MQAEAGHIGAAGSTFAPVIFRLNLKSHGHDSIPHAGTDGNSSSSRGRAPKNWVAPEPVCVPGFSPVFPLLQQKQLFERPHMQAGGNSPAISGFPEPF